MESEEVLRISHIVSGWIEASVDYDGIHTTSETGYNDYESYFDEM